MNKTYKTPTEMDDILIELYGTAYGSQRKLAEAIGKHEVSISRYCSGASPVDKTTAKLIDALVEKHRRKRKQPVAQMNINEIL